MKVKNKSINATNKIDQELLKEQKQAFYEYYISLYPDCTYTKKELEEIVNSQFIAISDMISKGIFDEYRVFNFGRFTIFPKEIFKYYNKAKAELLKVAHNEKKLKETKIRFKKLKELKENHANYKNTNPPNPFM